MYQRLDYKLLELVGKEVTIAEILSYLKTINFILTNMMTK
jgi:hypothetical protein